MADSLRASNQKPSEKKLRGLAFPFQKRNGQFPLALEDMVLVKNDLFTLFNTPRGSRVMRPDVGTNAEELVFESQGDLLKARLERSIRQTISSHAPNVNVVDVVFTEASTQLLAQVVYVIQGVRDNLTLAFDTSSSF